MPKKNLGGRPRKSGNGKGGEQWKQITEPKSSHYYEISSRGNVRRKLKNGDWYNMIPWITGGPYSAVYISGVAGATRNRKKAYIHRLVANHFNKASKKAGNVVHHTKGPSNNTKENLKWVTPSENQNARRFFTDDGKRKSKDAWKKRKIEKRVPPTQVPKERQARPVPPKQKKPTAPEKRLPDDPDGYYPIEGVDKQINWLIKSWRPFKLEWRKFRKEMPMVNRKNFADKFREATGKKFKSGSSPASWNTRLMSAMHEIARRLET